MSDCVFCRIVEGTIPSKKIHEDERLIAFHDLNPQAPQHFLVVPKRHIASLHEATESDAALLGHLLLAIPRLAEQVGIGSAYRVVNNCGSLAGQSVFHIHFHVLGGRAMSWPPG